MTHDLHEYEKFYFEKLSRVPGVREVHSFAAISEIKTTTALPI